MSRKGESAEGPGKTWKVRTVNSGANPDKFEFPDAIPQEVPEGTGTSEAMEAWAKGHGRRG